MHRIKGNIFKECKIQISLYCVTYGNHIPDEKPVKDIQCVPGRKVNILGGHSIGHSKQKCLCEHVSHSERFPR